MGGLLYHGAPLIITDEKVRNPEDL